MKPIEDAKGATTTAARTMRASHGCDELAQRFIRSLSAPIDVDDTTSIEISCSIGVCPGVEGESFATAMARADAALWEMKSNSRNGVLALSATDA